MTKQFSMSWSHWYRSIWWSYCTNFSLGNFSILLLLSNYQLDTDVSHILWLMFLCVPRCIITWHVRIFHTWKLKVNWIRPMLLWERDQITIVNFLDHSELQIPQKTFVSVWQGIKLRRILKQLVYCYVIAQHGFHVKVCPMTCTTCEPVSMNVATAPTDQIDIRVGDSGKKRPHSRAAKTSKKLKAI